MTHSTPPKRGWVARATLPRATNPIFGADLRVQTGVKVLLGIRVLACFGLVDLDGWMDRR